jgi:hypothetical protein
MQIATLNMVRTIENPNKHKEDSQKGQLASNKCNHRKHEATDMAGDYSPYV